MSSMQGIHVRYAAQLPIVRSNAHSLLHLIIRETQTLQTKSPFLMGKSPFLMGKSTINHHLMGFNMMVCLKIG